MVTVSTNSFDYIEVLQLNYPIQYFVVERLVRVAVHSPRSCAC
jgi:hypothetical protein